MKKILVSADAHTNFQFLIKKVTSLQAKNTFDFILCVGNVLDVTNMSDATKLKHFKIELPIPVYFIQSGPMAATLNLLYPDGGKILPNLYYLGRSGIKEIQGVTVAYLSGTANRTDKSFYFVGDTEYSAHYYTTNDIETLTGHEQPVDILLTNEWPFEATFPEASKQPTTKSHHINKIVHKLSPRYHFAGNEDLYYKRKQYRSRVGHPTAFISIGSLHRNPEDNKQKYLHAIQIVPLAVAPVEKMQQGEIQESPFKQASIISGGTQKGLIAQHSRKDKAAEGQQAEDPRIKDLTESPMIYFTGFNYDTNTSDIQEFVERWGQTSVFQIYFDQKANSHKGSGVVKFNDVGVAKQCLQESGKYSLHGSKIKFMIKNEPVATVKRITDEKCWFCRDSPAFDKSLVFHYGQNSYLALDKGPITPEHFLVVPCQHVYASVKASPQTRLEMKVQINTMREWFLKKSKALIVFERFLHLAHSINHCIVHVVPVDLSKVFKLIETFEEIILRDRLPFKKLSRQDLEQEAAKGNYFYIEIHEKIYFREVRDRQFPIDFGRQLVCQMLEVPDRMNWKRCVNEAASQKQMLIYKEAVKQSGL